MEQVKSLLRNLGLHEETVLDVIRETTTDAEGKAIPRMRLEVLRRDIQPEDQRPPVRAESPRRCHEFNDFEGFAAYLKKYGGENTVVLANAVTQVVSAVLDEKAAKGFEVVTLRPQLHPLLVPWSGIFGKKIPMAALVEFLLTWRRSVAIPGGKELAMMLSQVRAATRITLQQGRGNHSINGLKVETDIMGEKGQDLTDLPDMIELLVPVYVGTSEQSIEVDLTLSAPPSQPEGIIALLTSADFETAKVTAFEEMVQKLRSCETYTVGLGSPAHRPWEYLGTQDE